MKLTELVLLALALSTASARKCNPKKDTSCCRTPPRPSCPAARPRAEPAKEFIIPPSTDNFLARRR
jgi:hypothetical protein